MGSEGTPVLTPEQAQARDELLAVVRQERERIEQERCRLGLMIAALEIAEGMLAMDPAWLKAGGDRLAEAISRLAGK